MIQRLTPSTRKPLVSGDMQDSFVKTHIDRRLNAQLAWKHSSRTRDERLEKCDIFSGRGLGSALGRKRFERSAKRIDLIEIAVLQINDRPTSAAADDQTDGLQARDGFTHRSATNTELCRKRSVAETLSGLKAPFGNSTMQLLVRVVRKIFADHTRER